MLHGTHVKTIDIDVPPDVAFATISRPDLWVRLPGGEPSTLDFRVGGSFSASGTFRIPDRPVERVEVRYRYLAIEPSVLYFREAHVNGELLSAALVSIVLSPLPAGTLLTYSEQYTFIDRDDAVAAARELEGGTRLMLYGLKAAAEALKLP